MKCNHPLHLGLAVPSERTNSKPLPTPREAKSRYHRYALAKFNASMYLGHCLSLSCDVPKQTSSSSRPKISLLSSAPCRVDDDAACTETTPASKQKLGIATPWCGCLLDLLLLPSGKNTSTKRMCRFQRNWANPRSRIDLEIKRSRSPLSFLPISIPSTYPATST